MTRMLAVRLDSALMPPLAWAIISDAALPRGFARNSGFMPLSDMEESPVPPVEDYGIDLSNRRELRILSKDGASLFAASFRDPHSSRWAAAARSRGELGVILGNPALFTHAATAEMGMLSLAGSGARVARLPLAVHEWGDGKGTVA